MTVPCKQCDAKFENMTERRKHVRKVHADRLSRTCCGITFKTMREKKFHDQITHQETLEIPPDTTILLEEPKVTQHLPPDLKLQGVDAGTQTSKRSSEAIVTAPDGKEILLFYSAYHPFSNFYQAPFVVNGFSYATVEHYYQSEKARYFGDPSTYWTILKSWSPFKAKRMGSGICNYDKNVWQRVCERVMTDAVQEKIKQNPTIREKLEQTGDQILAEASKFDSFWGIGVDRDDPEARHYKAWPGENKLGNILMHIRNELLTDK